MNTKDKNTYIQKRKLLNSKKNIRNLIFIFLISIISLTFILNKTLNLKTEISSMTNNDTLLSNYQTTSNLDTEDIFTVVIDAGHGDWDVGAIGLTNSYEKDIVLDIALKLGPLLESQNINVVYTRTNDTLSWSDNSTENLYERVNISNENNADLFISIHCNSSYESSYYNGVETWYNIDDEESYLFASLIQNELSALEYTSDRGIKYYDKIEPLVVLEHNTAPSALIELGFISNLSDEAFLTSEKGQSLSAEAIYNAILAYKDTLN